MFKRLMAVCCLLSAAVSLWPPAASQGAQVVDFALAYNTIYVLDDTGTLWRAYYPPCSAWNSYEVRNAVAIVAGFAEDAVVAYDNGDLLPIYYGEPHSPLGYRATSEFAGQVEVALCETTAQNSLPSWIKNGGKVTR
jgi:hypothetical protein